MPSNPSLSGVRERFTVLEHSVRSIRVGVTVAVSLLIAAILLSVSATIVERARVDDAQHRLQTELRPAQSALDRLQKAYVDQETGQRGYLLTGDESFLQPYVAGRADAAAARSQLRRLFVKDPVSLQLLADAGLAATTWQQQAAEPEIAARRHGPMTADQVLPFARTGKTLFDGLRTKLDALASNVDNRTSTELAKVDRAQFNAELASAIAASVAVLAAALTGYILYRYLTKPLARLIAQVEAVSAGAYEQHIDTDGPIEVAQLATAVEAMRDNILRSSAKLVRAQRELSARDERDRLAANLQDSTIQRTFALGLALSSVASAEPEAAPRLEPLIAETDGIIAELRSVIFPGARAGPISPA